MRVLKPMPPDPEQMNEVRATWAQEALDYFEQYGESPHPRASESELRELAQQNLSDLIADFGHYCDRAGLRMQDVLRIATNHYDEETGQEGEQFRF